MAEPLDSGASTPSNNARFTSQGYTAEDILKQQTVGLVKLSDFRKRRAEALEQSERGNGGSNSHSNNVSRDGTPGIASGASTPDGREAEPSKSSATGFKKRRNVVKKIGLSFAGDEDDAEERESTDNAVKRNTTTSAPTTDTEHDSGTADENTQWSKKKKGLRPNSSVAVQPKALTKAAVLREAQLKQQLRKEYMAIQEAVQATEFCIPFVFSDGKDAPGGVCRMKKGDFIWRFLEQARKMGAGTGERSRRDWARIGVDDLMVVKGDLIIPHHYDFHYFMLNSSKGFNEEPLFPFSSQPTAATPKALIPQKSGGSAEVTTSADTASDREPTSYLQTASQRVAAAAAAAAQADIIPDEELEGHQDDPSQTKVVDRRWYVKNKHIFPASTWEEFDPTRDYSKGPRTDGKGNAFFFSR